MSEWLAGTRVIDLILVAMVVEGIALSLFHRRTGRGVSGAALAWNLAAGAGLLLALRGALSGLQWHWVALALLMALGAHVGDLSRRWQSGAR